MTRFVKMYNTVMNGKNNRMILLYKISVYCETKGIIGRNVEQISRIARCTYDNLTYPRDIKCDDENMIRAKAVLQRMRLLQSLISLQSSNLLLFYLHLVTDKAYSNLCMLYIQAARMT